MTEGGYDLLSIEGTDYSGRAVISQIVSTNFTVIFSSNENVTQDGFELEWKCLQKLEWNCRMLSSVPEIACDDDFTDSDNHKCTDYATNDLCTSDGDYGPAWNPDWGTFADLDLVDPNTGLTPWSCSACGCGLQGRQSYK